MRIKLFTLRFSATLGVIDDAALLDFLRDKELIAFREHFFAVADVPHVACVVAYHDLRPPTPERTADAASGGAPRNERFERRGAREDKFAGLSEAERLLFNELRTWRRARADQAGVPPYVVFNDRELLAIVRRKPDSLNALGAVAGVGSGKVAQYGAEVLRILGANATPAPPTAAVPPMETPPSEPAPASAEPQP